MVPFLLSPRLPAQVVHRERASAGARPAAQPGGAAAGAAAAGDPAAAAGTGAASGRGAGRRQRRQPSHLGEGRRAGGPVSLRVLLLGQVRSRIPSGDDLDHGSASFTNLIHVRPSVQLHKTHN